VMNSAVLSHRLMLVKPVEWARWQERHITFSVPVMGPAALAGLPVLEARADRVAMMVVPFSKGTMEV